ncbi:N-6 DNA methylase [Sediminibacterium sp.]|uniref:Eco57I restriction-modification methylase domain-containing protein n=1 Tax=Sediminibacterium sp. TaxID=1917865 RepID=UPI0025FE36D1|nr:N-6 DNA methylase [Sediminibacterium sp.]MDO8996272.1 N-6 DNA methylase [Sediminibacterium sp.]MDP2420012.1 N-6 DNA methylase [Sediminibacterium sp.]
MTTAIDINPLSNELPSHFADRVGQLYAKTVTTKHKKDNGQFFTPTEIAHFMAGLTKQTKDKLKILDPGCGTAILSSSLIETLTKQNVNLKEIELFVYETDQNILPYTLATLNYLTKWLKKYKIKFKVTLYTNDFVLENKDCFQVSATLFSEPQNAIYDIVISNPPYFKIPKEDKRASVAKSIVWGQPNIYSIFMMVATKLLKEGGELIFITPRSFASGNYFRAFREAFFQEIEIEQIHLFGSRTDTFDRDNVLQETLILKGKKQKLNEHLPSILVTHSNGIRDIENFTEKIYKTFELIDLKSKEKIIHLPTNETDDKVIKLFKSWAGSLRQFDIQISTGPVVSFRATQYLFEQYQNGTVFLVPLYQLINTAKMHFEWPVTKRSKPQYIQLCEETKSLLLPNKNYVFLRRFSAKDDKSRLVATPYFVDITQAEYIGVENHLNYIYRPKGHLERNEILGLAALLNSNLFDTYFRTFNGNINVSATELREMPLPPLEDIKQIGNQIILLNDFSQSRVDEIINNYFDIEHIFAYEQN